MCDRHAGCHLDKIGHGTKKKSRGCVKGERMAWSRPICFAMDVHVSVREGHSGDGRGAGERRIARMCWCHIDRNGSVGQSAVGVTRISGIICFGSRLLLGLLADFRDCAMTKTVHVAYVWLMSGLYKIMPGCAFRTVRSILYIIIII